MSLETASGDIEWERPLSLPSIFQNFDVAFEHLHTVESKICLLSRSSKMLALYLPLTS